jgi:hypothetical protein
MFTVTGTVNRGKAAAAIAKRSVPAIAKRADMLGADSVREVKRLIDREMGPGDGKSARRGLISMRDMPFRHEVNNPGVMPLSVTLINDVSGPSAVKFAAHEFGTKGDYQIFGQGGKTGDLVAFEGTRAPRTDRSVVVKSPVTHPGLPGRRFMPRAMTIATEGVQARFI